LVQKIANVTNKTKILVSVYYSVPYSIKRSYLMCVIWLKTLPYFGILSRNVAAILFNVFGSHFIFYL